MSAVEQHSPNPSFSFFEFSSMYHFLQFLLHFTTIIYVQRYFFLSFRPFLLFKALKVF